MRFRFQLKKFVDIIVARLFLVNYQYVFRKPKYYLILDPKFILAIANALLFW
jgi:hypothetical protein